MFRQFIPIWICLLLMFNLKITKRQKLVISAGALSFLLFLSEFISKGNLMLETAIVLPLLTVFLLFLALKNDINLKLSYPVFILPFFYTLAFILFYLLIPSRLLSRVFTMVIYGSGLYSLFLTQNIFSVSSIRTINLLRSARIVSFIITVVVLFLLASVIFSFNLPFYYMLPLIFLLIFLLNFQSFWAYSLDVKMLKEVFIYTFFNSLTITELSLILTIWPVNKIIYSIFLTGMFYTYSGLSHFWFERRLFKGILWEYVWVGFLSILVLLFFARWGV